MCFQSLNFSAKQLHSMLSFSLIGAQSVKQGIWQGLEHAEKQHCARSVSPQCYVLSWLLLFLSRLDHHQFSCTNPLFIRHDSSLLVFSLFWTIEKTQLFTRLSYTSASEMFSHWSVQCMFICLCYLALMNISLGVFFSCR